MPPIVALAASAAIGIWLAAELNQPLWAWLAFAGLAAGALALLRDGPRWRLPLACALLAGLGAARHEAARPLPGDAAFVATYNDTGEVALEGVVWAEPESQATRTDLRVRVETLTLTQGGQARTVTGQVLVQAPRYSTARLNATGDAGFHYGDRLRITGRLETPAVQRTAYRDYLARQGVHSQMRAARVAFVAARAGPPAMQALHDFKAHALARLNQLFPQPQAALLAGILLGADSGIPDDLRAAFNTTGTAHIIAISGQTAHLSPGSS